MKSYNLAALVLSCSVCALLTPASAAVISANDQFTLSTGTGDGDVSVTLNALGASSTAFFDPVGSIGRSDVFYASNVLLTQGSNLTQLYSDTPIDLVSQSGNSLVTSFSINQLAFTLTQTVAKSIDNDGIQTGSVLIQSYAVRNLADVPNSIQMVRYLDADLYLTDSTLADGGGRLGTGDNIVLYETDATGNASDTETFVGITATGGTLPDNYFAIARCCGVNNYPLPNTVTGDTDGDGFINNPYDVTLQLARDIRLTAGETKVFTTSTLFGNAQPPAPGSSPLLPLLPNATEVDELGVPTWSFTIEVQDYPEVVWIDPVIAVGYTYTVTGAEFFGVTAPGLGVIPDEDGLYTILVNGASYALASGASLDFTALGLGTVTSFQLTGIDVTPGLDPALATAFPTGILLGNWVGSSATVTQSPILSDSGNPPVVPLPAAAPLLLTGIVALGAFARRRRLAA